MLNYKTTSDGSFRFIRLASYTELRRFQISAVLFFIFGLSIVFAGSLVQAQETVNEDTSDKDSSSFALMERARQALSTGQYEQAIQIYTKVRDNPDGQFHKGALEFLGVAREKKGQLAHAKAIYEDYLKKYPFGVESTRVKQRLLGLISAASAPKAKRKSVKKKTHRDTVEWTTFGGLSQYYRYAELNIHDQLSANTVSTKLESSLSSDAYWSLRGRSKNWDSRFRVTGGYLNDFLPGNSKSDDRLSELYFDIENNNSNHGLRIGRQRNNSGGVLGRFDGIATTFQLTETKKLNFVYGHPVVSTNDVKLNTEKEFYGVNLDLGPYFGGWEFNTYLIEQRAGRFTDRQATGLEARFFNNGVSLFSLVDYDIYHSSLNTILIIGSWRANDATTFNATVDLRKSPLFTTSNALQGQTASSLEELASQFTKGEINDIASDRTADSTLLSAGLNHAFNDAWSLYGNLTLNKITDMRASAGVDALPGTDNELSYDLQLIGSGILKESDSTILSLRYFDGTTSNRTSVSLDIRYPITRAFRVNPRIRVDYRQSIRDDTDQTTYRPSIKITYRPKRKIHFEMELAGEWSTRALTNNNEEKTRGLFGTIGYRIDL